MNNIDTNLTTSGNSVAVRLPRQLLQQSGLQGRVRLEAQDGQITITQASQPRADWEEKIQALCKTTDPAAEFADLDATIGDGLDEAPWSGPSFEEWQRHADKLS